MLAHHRLIRTRRDGAARCGNAQILEALKKACHMALLRTEGLPILCHFRSQRYHLNVCY